MWHRWLAAGAIILALILTPFFVFEDAIQAWTAAHLAAGRGWIVGLLIAGLLAADIFLPVPSSIVSTSAGLLLGFGGGLIASTAGMCAGAVLGYGFGAAAGDSLLRRFVGEAEMRKATALSRKYGAAALIVSRPIPVLAEASVVFAGVTRMPLMTFLMLTTLSNLGISAVYAAVGAMSYGGASFLYAFLGAVAIPGIAMALARALGWTR